MAHSPSFRRLLYITLGSALVASGAACGTDGVGSGPNVDLDAGPSTSTELTLGGSVTGLVGEGLVLANGSSTLSVAKAAASFSFAQKLSQGAAYDVVVQTQPTAPAQTCVVTKGAGIANANVSDVQVSCTTNAYAISVNVVGASSEGLVLQNNGADDLTIPASAAPQKATFATKVESGKPFAVTVKSQPKNPNQLCTVSGGTGTVVAGDVASITVNCSAAYVVGGTVTGLAGTGLVLQNNGGDDIPVNANGQFAFPTPLVDGATYSVAVKADGQPQTPWQTCTVSGGSGTIAGADVSNVTVDCATNPYTVSVAVAGLAGSGLTLQNDGSDDLAVAADGTSTFATSILSGETYDVQVSAQPQNPWQTCTVVNGAGTMKGSNVTLDVACTTDKHSVGGFVSGLKGSGLVLKVNGVALPAINADGAFTGPMLDSGTAYTVTIDTAPSSPAQTCSVVNGTGTVAGADITSVFVSCGNLLLVHASSYASDVQTKLTASGVFSTVDVFNAGSGTPTLANLESHDAALVFSDSGFADPTALGNALADYFDAGGRVVMATFSNVSSYAIAGRWVSENYHLIDLKPQIQPNSQGALTILDAASPLVSGVTTLTATAAFQSTGGAVNGGTVVATWGSGGVLIVSGVKNGRKHAELNMYPPSSTIRSDFWVGDGVPMMVNALLYQ